MKAAEEALENAIENDCDDEIRQAQAGQLMLHRFQNMYTSDRQEWAGHQILNATRTTKIPRESAARMLG